MPRVKVTGLCLRPRRNNPTGHSENTGNVHEWMKSSSRVGSLNQERLRDKDEPGRIRTCVDRLPERLPSQRLQAQTVRRAVSVVRIREWSLGRLHSARRIVP